MTVFGETLGAVGDMPWRIDAYIEGFVVGICIWYGETEGFMYAHDEYIYGYMGYVFNGSCLS